MRQKRSCTLTIVFGGGRSLLAWTGVVWGCGMDSGRQKTRGGEHSGTVKGILQASSRKG